MTDNLLGRTFGDFRIDALVGSGSAGRVYSATQLSLKRRVALKVLDESRANFQREAEVVAALEHPHIVPIYAFGHEGDRLYYAMRFVEGKTLKTLISEGLSVGAGARHLADVAAALEYAHARGVAHGDLKPANVLVAEGSAMLSDFGLARGEGAGPQEDYRALGAILREIAEANFPPPSEIPKPVADLIRDLGARPTKVRDALMKIAGAESVVAPSEAQGAKVFGKYRLMEQIGHGGMGVVFKARQTDLKRDVALKVMNFGPDVDATAVERFRREAQAVARLRHPNIVAVHEAGDVEGRPYFCMDLVDGRSLSAMLEEGPLPVRRAMEIVLDVAAAIVHAHAEGVVHRDLKPANVLVDASGRVYVADFGLARSIVADGTKLTQSGDVVGTPAYMAPEQARGASGTVDPRTDVYGMGAILYHMLAGAAPFDGPDVYHVLADVVGTDPTTPRKRNDKVHVDAETICLRAMEKDPARRYATAADFRADVERFLAGEPIEARPAGAWSKLVKRVRRRPAVAALILVVVAGLVAGGAIFALRQSQHRRRVQAREMTREASMHYLAGDCADAEARARRATEVDPAWGPGWFWLARVDLRRYAEGRGVPSVWKTEGELEFDPPAADTPEAAALREAALGKLRRSQGLEGSGDWEGTFTSAVLDFFDGRYDAARRSFERILGKAPDREIDAYLAQSLYYARRFDEALAAAETGFGRWGNVERFLAVKVNALLARGLARTLRGEDPTDLYAQAFATADGPILKARTSTLTGDWRFAVGGDAESEYRKAIDFLKDIETPDAHVARGDALLGLAIAEAAGGRVDPDDPRAFTDALDAYNRALAGAPDAPSNHFKRAQARAAMTEFLAPVGRVKDTKSHDLIIGDYERVVAVREDYVDARIALLRWRFSKRTSESKDKEEHRRLTAEYIADISKIAAARRDVARVHLALGGAWIDMGNLEFTIGIGPLRSFEKSIETFSAALAVNNGYTEALIRRGQAHGNIQRTSLDSAAVPRDVGAKHFALALEDFEAASRNNPKSVVAALDAAQCWIDEGNALQRAGEDPTAIFEKARVWIDRALSVNKAHGPTYVALGRMEMIQFGYDSSHGRSKEAQASIDRAERAFTESLKFDATDAMAHAMLGQLYGFRFARVRPPDFDLLDEALKHLLASIDANSSNARVWSNLGEYLVLRAQFQTEPERTADDLIQAETSYRTAIEINAALPNARLGLAKVLIERAQRTIGDPADREPLLREAVACAGRVVEDFHDDANAHRTRAAATLTLGINLASRDRLAEARPFLEVSVEGYRVAERLDGNRGSRRELGRALYILERWKECLEAIKDWPSGDRLVDELRRDCEQRLQGTDY